MARAWAPSGVVGSPGDDAYNLTVSGLNATINRRAATGVAEAWVDGHMHRLITANWTNAVTPETTANPRVDRIVLRLDPVANTVTLTRLPGTAAASPSAPALTQINDGVWDLPLWRFTVPASSGSPLTGLVDERQWIDITNPAARIVAYGSTASTQSLTTTSARILGGLNVSPSLRPGRLYEIEVGGLSLTGSGNSTTVLAEIRGLLGATPTSSTGTVVSNLSITNVTVAGPTTMTGKFSVASTGTYTLAPFGYVSPAANTGNFGPSGSAAPATIVIRDAGPLIGVVGTTPLVIP